MGRWSIMSDCKDRTGVKFVSFPHGDICVGASVQRVELLHGSQGMSIE